MVNLPKYPKSYYVTKQNGGILFQDNGGNGFHNMESINLFREADELYNLPDFPLTLVLTDSWNELSKYRNIKQKIGIENLKVLSFSANEELGRQNTIPDSFFKLDLGEEASSYDAFCAKIAAAGALKPQNSKLGWEGVENGFLVTDKKYNPREILIKLSKKYPAKIYAAYSLMDNKGPFGETVPLLNAIAKYKYLIDVEGYGFNRLFKFLLFSRRVLFLQYRPWQEWFYEDLKPYVHYIPVRRDLSNLIEQLNWIESHPEKYDEIAANAFQFAQKKLTKSAALRRIDKVINSLVASVPKADKQKYWKIDPKSPSSKIPKIIWQTWRSYEMPPDMLAATKSWKNKNPDFEYVFFDDKAVEEYLQKFDCSDFSFNKQTLLKAYQKVCPPAGKADIFRYLLLYERGGIYADIYTICLKPISEILEFGIDFILGFGEFNGIKAFHQWAFITTPKHPYIKAAIEISVYNVIEEHFCRKYRHVMNLTGPVAFTAAINKVNGYPEEFEEYTPGKHALKGGTIRILEDKKFRAIIQSKYSGYRAEMKELGITKAYFLPIFNESTNKFWASSPELPWLKLIEPVDTFNTNWASYFEKNFDHFKNISLQNYWRDKNNYHFVIYQNKLYFKNSNNLAFNQWKKYLQLIIQQWVAISKAKRIPNALLSFNYLDAHEGANIKTPYFFPSKTLNSNALLWFDWDHLDCLLDTDNHVDAPNRAAIKTRTLIPIWRGSIQYYRIPKNIQKNGEEIHSFLKGKTRLKLVGFSANNSLLLDAKASGLKINAKKQEHWALPEIKCNTNWLDFDLIEKNAYYSQYQNVIVVDGIGAAFRLINHFKNGQTVLLQCGNYEQYFYPYLVPWKHYIPLAADLGDLKEQLLWIKDHLQECLEIGLNGRQFYEQYLTWNPCFDLTQKIISKLSAHQTQLDFEEIIESIELKHQSV